MWRWLVGWTGPVIQHKSHRSLQAIPHHTVNMLFHWTLIMWPFSVLNNIFLTVAEKQKLIYYIGWVADNTSLSKTTNQVIHLIRSLQRSDRRCEHSIVPNWPLNSAQQVKCKGNEDKNATNVGAWWWENSRMEQCLLCVDMDMAVPIYCSGFRTLYNSICSGSDLHNSEKSCSPVHAVWVCQVKLFPNIIQALPAIITVPYLPPIPKTEFCFAFFFPSRTISSCSWADVSITTKSEHMKVISNQRNPSFPDEILRFTSQLYHYDQGLFQ